MTHLNRRTALGFLGSGWVAACAPVRVAETEKTQPRGGIGGTGIVGTLTDFSSLIVNGLKIETDGGTEATSAYGPLDISGLAIGHSLTIEAGQSDQGLIARRVHLTHPVIGTVTAISPDGRSGTINGIAVDLEPGAIGALVPGDRLAVSGIWRDDRVVASRLDPAIPGQPDVIAGELMPEGRGGLAGRAIGLGSIAAPAAGTFVTLLGTNLPERFSVRDLRVGRFTGAAGSLVQLSVDGYLDPIAAAPFFRLSGLGHSFDTAARLGVVGKDRALFSGPYRGAFEVATALPLPSDFSARRERMREVLGGTVKSGFLSTR